LSFTGTGFGKARRVTKPINGMGRKPLEDVFGVDEGIALVPLATCHEAMKGWRCSASHDSSLASDRLFDSGLEGITDQTGNQPA